jgi:hypothetical protein
MNDIDDSNDPISDLLAVPSDSVASDGVLRLTMLEQTLRVIRRRRRQRRCVMAATALGCILGVTGLIAVWRSPASSSPSRYEVFRRAGDQHLQHPDGLALAMDEYRNAVEVASERELLPSPETDSWLLAAIKTERLNAEFHSDHAAP